MALTLRIVDTFVENRHGIKNGKPWSMNQQVNCFLNINDEIRRFPLLINDGEQPKQPGTYQFDAEKLVTVGQYGLEIDRYKPLGLVLINSSLSPLTNK